MQSALKGRDTPSSLSESLSLLFLSIICLFDLIVFVRFFSSSFFFKLVNVNDYV